MPINIRFILHRNHAIVKHAGLVTAQPALEAQGRLYAIHNPTTSRHVYVGTASNLQHRFLERIAAVREFGFNNAAMRPITVHAYRVTVNGRARRPNNFGFAGGIDVEHLLIRLHMNRGVTVRNMNKVAAYTNHSGQAINLRLTSSPALAVPAYLGGAVINVAIANNGSY